MVRPPAPIGRWVPVGPMGEEIVLVAAVYATYQTVFDPVVAAVSGVSAVDGSAVWGSMADHYSGLQDVCGGLSAVSSSFPASDSVGLSWHRYPSLFA